MKKSIRNQKLPKANATHGVLKGLHPGPWVVRTLAATLMGITLLFIHDLMTQTRHFAMTGLEIVGGARLGEKEICEQAGITGAPNLLSLNLGVVRKRLEAHPWIREAAIDRILPDRLRIEIKEEEAVAVLHFSPEPDAGYLVTETGRIFKKATAEEQEGPIAIHGLEYPDLHHAESESPFGSVAALIRLVQNTPWLQAPGIRIRVDRDMGLTLEQTAVAQTIHYGFEQLEKKTDRLKRALEKRRELAPESPVIRIDLVRPDRVIVTPAPV